MAVVLLAVGALLVVAGAALVSPAAVLIALGALAVVAGFDLLPDA